MIKLFRNIRQNLLVEGKTTKYFKYAIGEIILVVIGILIALSINNWNENRKTNIKSYAYLQRLNEDVENVLKTVNQSLSDTERKQKNSILVLEALESNELPNSKQNDFSRYLKEYYQFQITIQDMNTFNEMMSSGDLNLIKNQWLRNAFSNLSTYRDFVMEVNQSNHNAYKINNDLFQKHVRYHVKNVDTDSTKVTTSYNFNEMANDTLFINQISNQSYNWHEISWMYKEYTSSVEQIKDTIQVELKKYDK
jgi:uncharacterized membrane protein YgaE (UPF0421/DUF939 family)